MQSKRTTQKHGRRYPVSLTAAAVRFGVSREHLSRVLNGHTTSAPVMRKWTRLLMKEGHRAA